jgi:hypothetical protein
MYLQSRILSYLRRYLHCGVSKMADDETNGSPLDEKTKEEIRSLIREKEAAEWSLREAEGRLLRANRQKFASALLTVTLVAASGTLLVQERSKHNNDLQYRRQESVRLEDSQSRISELSRERASLQAELDRARASRRIEPLKHYDVTLAQKYYREALVLDSSRSLSPKGPFWNVWEEPDSNVPSFSPLPALLKGGTKYSLFVDLSAIRYATTSAVISMPVSTPFKGTLDSKQGVSTNIDLVLIPDGVFLELQGDSDKAKRVSIDLNKWRSTSGKDFSGVGDPFPILQNNSDPEFRFGHEVFGIQTRGKSGMGYVAISIWIDNKPVDEISVPVCVVDDDTKAALAECERHPATTYTFRGVNLFNHGSLPDAALHLVQLNSKTLAGVFSCQDCQTVNNGNYFTWILRSTPVGLRDALNNQVVIPFENAALKTDTTSYQQFVDGGDALYNLIFRDNSGRVEPSDAEIAFRNFIKRVIQAEPTQQTITTVTMTKSPPMFLPGTANPVKPARPSMFVRLLPESPDLAFAIPLDLMAVPVSDQREEFVGLHLKVYSPLEEQDYSVSQSCIDSWRLFVPGPNIDLGTDMDRARQPFLDDIVKFRAWKNHATVDFNVADFNGWIGQRAESVQGTAVVTLSHHALGKLCFTDPNCSMGESVKEANIWRVFAQPSLAVINACGTAAPGASEFVRHLNSQGIEAVIATSATVEPEMAGEFLKLLVDRLEASTDSTYTISDAKFDAVKSLAVAYGPKALVYSFLGNDSLRACGPPRRPE